MARRINQQKLLEGIAKLTGSNVEDLKKVAEAGNRYSHDEQIMEVQSVINFYRTRIQPKEPKQEKGENALEFAKRKVAYEKAYNEWRFQTCEGCNLPFAYAYHYAGVKFCSLDCMDGELRKIGLRVTPGRDLSLRWGKYGPAIVPSTALATLVELYPHSDGSSDVPEWFDHPSPQSNVHEEYSELQEYSG